MCGDKLHVAVLKMFSEHSVTVTEASQELLTLPRETSLPHEMVRGGSDKTKAVVKTLGKGEGAPCRQHPSKCRTEIKAKFWEEGILAMN